MANQYNPYGSQTLQGNWWEERFFHADTRKDEKSSSIRPEWDEVENIPRVSRKIIPTGDVLKMQNDDPEDRFTTISGSTYVEHHVESDSVTRRRMNATPEHMAELLSVDPPENVLNYSLPPRGPEKQFKTIYQKSYGRN